jgi:hypothetical protein
MLKMTLIEIMLQYQSYMKDVGLVRATQFLHDVCDKSLWPHIEYSFDHSGNFLCADGRLIVVGDGRFLRITPK